MGKNKFGGINTTYYFSGMKESVKIESSIVDKAREVAKERGQTIAGFFELAANQSINPQYWFMENSDAFRSFLRKRDIEYKGAGSATILIGITNPVAIGTEWGIYKAQNSPQFKKK